MVWRLIFTLYISGLEASIDHSMYKLGIHQVSLTMTGIVFGR